MTTRYWLAIMRMPYTAERKYFRYWIEHPAVDSLTKFFVSAVRNGSVRL